MPTHQDETLPQRYAREHRDYLKLCGSMTAEQVADIQLQLHNSLAREQALQQRLTAANERSHVLDGLLRDQVTQINLVISSLEFDEKLHGSNPERSTLDFPHAIRILSRVKAALKPAEGGGDA